MHCSCTATAVFEGHSGICKCNIMRCIADALLLCLKGIALHLLLLRSTLFEVYCIALLLHLSNAATALDYI